MEHVGEEEWNPKEGIIHLKKGERTEFTVAATSQLDRCHALTGPGTVVLTYTFYRGNVIL